MKQIDLISKSVITHYSSKKITTNLEEKAKKVDYILFREYFEKLKNDTIEEFLEICESEEQKFLSKLILNNLFNNDFIECYKNTYIN